MSKNFANDNLDKGRPVSIPRERRPDIKPVKPAKQRPPGNRTSGGTARQYSGK